MSAVPHPAPPRDRSQKAAIRTCVGCRERTALDDLLRVVATGDELCPDPRRRLTGRGAYIHLDRDCLEQALRRRAFPRALRLAGPVDPARLRDYVAAAVSSAAGPAPARIAEPPSRGQMYVGGR